MKKSALLAIGVGGLIAGALDITQAITLFGKKVPLVIAAGLLGKGALHRPARDHGPLSAGGESGRYCCGCHHLKEHGLDNGCRPAESVCSMARCARTAPYRERPRLAAASKEEALGKGGR